MLPFFPHRKIRHYVSLKWPLNDNNKVCFQFSSFFDRIEVIICIITCFARLSLQSDKSSERVQAESQTGKSYSRIIFSKTFQGIFQNGCRVLWGSYSAPLSAIVRKALIVLLVICHKVNI